MPYVLRRGNTDKTSPYTTTLPVTPTYDESSLDYDDTLNYYNVGEIQTKAPVRGKVLFDSLRGKITTQTGLRISQGNDTYNDDVDYNDEDRPYGIDEVDSEKPKGGKIIRSF